MVVEPSLPTRRPRGTRHAQKTKRTRVGQLRPRRPMRRETLGVRASDRHLVPARGRIQWRGGGTRRTRRRTRTRGGVGSAVGRRGVRRRRSPGRTRRIRSERAPRGGSVSEYSLVAAGSSSSAESKGSGSRARPTGCGGAAALGGTASGSSATDDFRRSRLRRGRGGGGDAAERGRRSRATRRRRSSRARAVVVVVVVVVVRCRGGGVEEGLAQGRCAPSEVREDASAAARRRGRRAGEGVAEGVRIVSAGSSRAALGREQRGGAVLGGEHRSRWWRRVPGRVLGLGGRRCSGMGAAPRSPRWGPRGTRPRPRRSRTRSRSPRARRARRAPRGHARGARLEVLGAHRRERPGVAGARSGRGRRRGAKWRGARGESSSATHQRRRPKAIRNGRKELRSARRDRGPSFRRGGGARTACAGRTRGPRASGRRTRAGGFLSRGSGGKPRDV